MPASLAVARIVFFGELHDVDPMRTKRGANRRRRGCFARLNREFDESFDFFSHDSVLVISH